MIYFFLKGQGNDHISSFLEGLRRMISFQAFNCSQLGFSYQMVFEVCLKDGAFELGKVIVVKFRKLHP